MKLTDDHKWTLGYPVLKTVAVKEGRYYIDGHRQKRGPMKAEHSYFVDDRGWCFYANGQRMAKSGEPSRDHLVSEWVDPDAEGPVRTVTRREIVPGVYGHITVDRTENDGQLVLLGFKTTGNIFPETRSLFDAHELRSAAMVLSQLAEALDDA